ncbi:MAG: hypothetical protein RR253_03925 [Oscillospiraceae bacterium]
MELKDCHPFLSLSFISFALFFTLCFSHPGYIACGYLCAGACCFMAYGKRALIFQFFITLIAVISAFLYAYSHHFGTVNIFINIAENQFTLEAFCYGISLYFRLLIACLWILYFYSVFSADKVVYVTGRFCPKISLFLCTLFRILPLSKEKFSANFLVRRHICLPHKHFFGLLFEIFKSLSITVSYILDCLLQSKSVANSRGYLLPNKSKFSIFQFYNRERTLSLIIFFTASVCGSALFLQQGSIKYNPYMVFPVHSAFWFIFLICYMFFCLIPIFLKISYSFTHNICV